MNKKIASLLVCMLLLASCAKQPVSAATSAVAPVRTPEHIPVQTATPAPLTVQISAPQAALGEVLILSAVGTNGETPQVTDTDLPFTPQFYPNGDGFVALLPLSYKMSPGVYMLTIAVNDQRFAFSVQAQQRDWDVQYLEISQSVVDTTDTDEAKAEWNRVIEPLKLTADPVRYWTGAFVQPVEGEITTEYGSIRYTNGSADAVRHSGIDIAAARGTPVAAANNGRVAFAGYLQLAGNTVVLEHGFGLKSFYYHMDSLEVTAEEMVETGDIIGTVGDTGYATGPHLHYSLLVNNVFVNPWTTFATGIDPDV